MGNPAFKNASRVDDLRPSGPVLYLEHDDTWDKRGMGDVLFLEQDSTWRLGAVFYVTALGNNDPL